MTRWWPVPARAEAWPPSSSPAVGHVSPWWTRRASPGTRRAVTWLGRGGGNCSASWGSPRRGGWSSATAAGAAAGAAGGRRWGGGGGGGGWRGGGGGGGGGGGAGGGGAPPPPPDGPI